MTGDPLRFEVAAEEAGEAVLSLLGERLFDATSAGLRDLIEDGEVLLNGRRCGPRQAVAAGDALEVWTEGLERIAPARLPGLEPLHQEPDLLVVAKPPGVSVECERGQDDRPLRAGLLHLLGQLGRAGDRPRPAHRLDKDTSGALMVATTRQGLVALTAQLEAHTVEKTYLALVSGVPREERGQVEVPLPGVRGEVPRPALTRWEVVERFRRHALVRAWPVTGRPHQVRLHMQAIGHPLLVDPQHGGGQELLLSKIKRGYRGRRDQPERPLIARLTLHAQAVAFDCPGDGRRVRVEAPLPDDMQVALRQLRKWDT